MSEKGETYRGVETVPKEWPAQGQYAACKLGN